MIFLEPQLDPVHIDFAPPNIWLYHAYNLVFNLFLIKFGQFQFFFEIIYLEFGI